MIVMLRNKHMIVKLIQYLSYHKLGKVLFMRINRKCVQDWKFIVTQRWNLFRKLILMDNLFK
jgi:hypothetical protein